MRLSSFPHGVHLDESKERTEGLPIQRFGFAPYSICLLSQHLGKPAKAVVKAGQEVQRGQVIAEADGALSVPIHAPATGTVSKIGLSLDQSGKLTPSIVIQPFAASEQIPLQGPEQNPMDFTSEELVSALKEVGMVGLGGAAFPTHFKLQSSIEKGAKTLIINACESEPY